MSALDGNWVDMLTISGGLVGVFVKPILRYARSRPPCWIHRTAVNDFLNAASFAPFALLLLAPFNHWVLNELVAATKVTLGLAGGIGILYVVKELLSLEV